MAPRGIADGRRCLFDGLLAVRDDGGRRAWGEVQTYFGTSVCAASPVRLPVTVLAMPIPAPNNRRTPFQRHLRGFLERLRP